MMTITSRNSTQILEDELVTNLNHFKHLKMKDLKASIDRINIKTNEICEEWINHNLVKTNYFPSRQFKSADTYLYQDKASVTILRDNKSSKYRYKHKIEINPNSFENYHEMKRLLLSIVKDEAHLISRIDISFLFPVERISVRSFQLSCFVKHKEKHSVHSSNTKEYNRSAVSTISYGKVPHRISIYDRSLKNTRSEDYINFEIQFSNTYVSKKLKVATLSSFEDIYKRKPLHNIRFKNVMSNKKTILRESTEKKILSFRYKTAVDGLQIARSAYNYDFNNKFSRDIEPHFESIKISDNKLLFNALNLVFKRDMKRYFKPNSKKHKNSA